VRGYNPSTEHGRGDETGDDRKRRKRDDQDKTSRGESIGVGSDRRRAVTTRQVDVDHY